MSKKEPRDLMHVTAKKIAEDVWLVGWLFSTRKSGENTVRAVADLYHAFDEKEKERAQDDTPAQTSALPR